LTETTVNAKKRTSDVTEFRSNWVYPFTYGH